MLRFTRWVGKGFWAVLDQGLFAGSNFLFNLMLARWLSPQEYGAFAVLFALFLLLGTMHNSLLSEPMLIFGSGRYNERLPAYLGVIVYSHFALTGLMGLLVVGTGIVLKVYGAAFWSGPTVLLGAAVPFVLFQWLMRRACYVRVQPRLAALAGVIYMAVILVSTYVLHRSESLSIGSSLAAWATASLVAVGWLLIPLDVNKSWMSAKSLARAVTIDHIRYGRWAVGTSVLQWGPKNVYYLVLAAASGLEATAALKALSNLIMPILHTNQALSQLLLPMLVRKRNSPAFLELLRLSLSFFVLGIILPSARTERPLLHYAQLQSSDEETHSASRA